MKSNSKEILQFVYHQRDKASPAQTFEKIKEKWPKCTDISLKDVQKMYSEIDLVKTDEFSNGLKYSIETFEVNLYQDWVEKK